MAGPGVRVAAVSLGLLAVTAAGLAAAGHVAVGRSLMLPVLAARLGQSLAPDAMRTTGLWSYGGELPAGKVEESLRLDLPSWRLIRRLKLVTAKGSRIDARLEAPVLAPLAVKRVAGDARIDETIRVDAPSAKFVLLAPLFQGAGVSGTASFDLREPTTPKSARGYVEAKLRYETAPAILGMRYRASLDMRLDIADGKATVARADLASDFFDGNASGDVTLAESLADSKLAVTIEGGLSQAFGFLFDALGLRSDESGRLKLAATGTLAEPAVVPHGELALRQSPEFPFVDPGQPDCYKAAFIGSDVAKDKAAAARAELAPLDCLAEGAGPGLIAFELGADARGARLVEVSADDLLGRIGLKSGDVLRAVGGTAVDADARFQIVRDIGAAEREVLVEAERDGREVRLLVVRVSGLERARGRAALAAKDAGAVTLSMAERKELLGEGYGTALQTARIVPHLEAGEMVGFRIFSIAGDGLFARLGLKNDDVILAVDGVPLDAPEQGFEVFSRLADAATVEILLARAGEVLKLTVTD